MNRVCPGQGETWSPQCPALEIFYLCKLHLGYLLFSHPVMSNSLQPHGLQHTRPLCPSPSPEVCLNSCPLVLPIYLLLLSCVWLYATPCTIALQAPLSMGFSQKEYWSGLPFPFSEDLPNWTGISCISCIAGGFFTTEPLGKPHSGPILILKNYLLLIWN